MNSRSVVVWQRDINGRGSESSDTWVNPIWARQTESKTHPSRQARNWNAAPLRHCENSSALRWTTILPGSARKNPGRTLSGRSNRSHRSRPRYMAGHEGDHDRGVLAVGKERERSRRSGRAGDVGPVAATCDALIDRRGEPAQGRVARGTGGHDLVTERGVLCDRGTSACDHRRRYEVARQRAAASASSTDLSSDRLITIR
jgi:hypothetical protein